MGFPYDGIYFICILSFIHCMYSDKSVISVIADSNSLHYDNNYTFYPMDATLQAVNNTLSVNQTGCIGVSLTSPASAICCIVLVSIAIATVGGNALVILAVVLVKKLRTPSNILIVSLAVSDLFVGIAVLPFTIIDTLLGYWPFNEGICDMYISFDVLLCTSSILTLCAISIDRYLVITRPLTYISGRTPRRMIMMILASWIISALITIPPNFGWKNPFEECKCEYSKDEGYQIYATIGAFYLPLLIMIILYGKIFRLARAMARAEKLQLKPSNNSDHVVTPSSQQYDIAAAPRDEQSIKPDSGTDIRGSFLSSVRSESADLPDAGQRLINSEFQLREKSLSEDSSMMHSVRYTSASGRNPGSPIVETPRQKSKSNVDTKVIKTLGVIMGCFCLCWVPFFLVQLLRAVLAAAGYNTDNLISIGAFRFLQWLGYINSVLNPIIYAKYNTEFRLPFKMILLCQCGHINERLRSAAFSSQFGQPSESSTKWMRSVSAGTKRGSRLNSYHSNCRNSTGQSRPRPPSHLLTMKSMEKSNREAS